MSYIVALTGGICSGKSVVAKKFSNLSKKVSVIDADVISKNITQPGSIALRMITKHFGPHILFSNGSLNRSMLKKIIFFNPKDKEWLEQLLHPLIRKETQKTINILSNRSSYILWVVPLLIENNLQKYADHILMIDVHVDIQLNRIISRDKIHKQYAENILLSQVSRQHRLNYADNVIENNKSIDGMTQHIHNLHRDYLKAEKTTTKKTIFSK
ncbi:Dephospho-CoA kinase [Candidatus Blochmanniella pennsylvanica str. BPEN]|uniref:Dephospho-CoA kinase n=1 Tax=Blochmanniella pennsylvanica (strain BPEN) TaxID=291272 RepID=COAE_BLOPB|nr:dephospho-CoA kinase [Candidatus Blochmannia pennsylvanicus]Q493P4.1 RecName: Full=Dephospho-CoA kinase; AltName: Full=Dephosphocoenzyme A kinase [Candidatus Blochmannia pennsylvanicus str. BPEN]AAZ40793.1 Dephospho-CoA kinase [Candidatus Blochmannia pennsylvanicus str. BPEN]